MTSKPQHSQSGWMAYVFTDVEGSTQLWQADEDAFSWALVEHDAIVRECLGHNDGSEVKHTGDGFFLTFPVPLDAVRFGAELMARIRGHEWPRGLPPIRARVGINWGLARRHHDDYRGAAVSLAARICDAANGGQVLVSTDVVEALAGHPEFSNRTRYVGEVQLAGIQGITPLFEVMLPDAETVPESREPAEPELPDLTVSTSPEMLDPDELWRRARQALKLGDHTDALTWLVGLYDRTPDDPRLLASLGVAFAAVQRLDRAEHCLRRATELDGREASVWYNLARVYGKLGQRDRVAWALDGALRADPQHEKALEAARKYGLRRD
ncbi:MAG: hypothetical protein HZB16_00145 [Armatimonadetes bacterium]|nr:hypothetical protein [Armatimonadota bacterium]